MLDDQGDDVSSHADTIRGELLGESPYGTFESAAKAFAALDALLAENQRLETDLDRTTTAANRIEQQLVEAASVMVKLQAENQRLKDELERLKRGDG